MEPVTMPETVNIDLSSATAGRRNSSVVKTIAAVAFFGFFVSAAAAQESFMVQTETRYWDSAGATPGYTLFATGGSTFLIDFKGRVVHGWSVGNNSRFTDAGTLLSATGSTPDSMSSWKELDWDGTVVWQYSETRTGYHAHDDFARIFNPKLQDSTFLYIANRDLTAAECVAAGCDPQYDYTGAQMDAIVEADRQGNVVWEWHFFDHAVQDLYPAKPTYGSVAGHPGKIDLNMRGNPVSKDWLHCNSIDYNQVLDQIVINSSHGEFYVIDHGNTFLPGNPSGSITLAAGVAGDFLYRFGDPARYDQGDPPSVLDNWEKATSGTKQLGASHDVQWIAPGLTGAGHFLVFNNSQHLFELTPQSYILEIDPYMNGAGVSTGQYVNPPAAGYNLVNSPDANLMKEKRKVSKQVVWSFASKNNTSFFSTSGSGVQVLNGGTLLVCAMNDGHLFEIKRADTTLVWEYVNPITSAGIRHVKRDHYPLFNPVYRARRYVATHPALAGHDLTPGSTITGMEPDFLTPSDLIVALNTQVQNVTVHNGESVCYDAQQTLTVAGSGTTVTVQSGGSSVFVAGKNILFEKGGRVYSGGHLHGSVTLNGQYCSAQSSPVMTLSDGDCLLTETASCPLFRLFPNPTQGLITLEQTDKNRLMPVSIRIHSIRGELLGIMETECNASYTLSVAGLPAGIYMVTVITAKESFTLKVIKT